MVLDYIYGGEDGVLIKMDIEYILRWTNLTQGQEWEKVFDKS